MLFQVQRGIPLDNEVTCPIENCGRTFDQRSLLAQHVGIFHELSETLYEKVRSAMRQFGGVDAKSFKCRRLSCTGLGEMSLTEFISHLSIKHYKAALLKELRDLQVNSPNYVLLLGH